MEKTSERHVIQLSTSTCRPCDTLLEMVEKCLVEKELEGYERVMLDERDDDGNLLLPDSDLPGKAYQYMKMKAVRGVPFVVFFEDGEIVGAVPDRGRVPNPNIILEYVINFLTRDDDAAATPFNLLSLGEERVRTRFNPSHNSEVDRVKHIYAKLINELDALPNPNRDPELVRLRNIAQEKVETAAEKHVKAITFNYGLNG